MFWRQSDHGHHDNLLCRSVFLQLCRIAYPPTPPTPPPPPPTCHLLMRRRSWFHPSFFRDYCSFLLASLQHNAARLVLGKGGRDHAKPLLRSLHWLPVWSWIEYKIPPCAIVAEIHLVLPTCLVFSLSISLPSLCILQTLVSWLFHASNSTSMESVL